MTEAQEFLQPFIDNNIYWIHKCLLIGIIGAVITVVFVIIPRINWYGFYYRMESFAYAILSRMSYYNCYSKLKSIFNVSALLIGIISLAFFISTLVIKCENIDMEKFPEATYNKMKRSVKVE